MNIAAIIWNPKKNQTGWLLHINGGDRELQQA